MFRACAKLFAKNMFPAQIDSNALIDTDLDVCRKAYIKLLREKVAGGSKDEDKAPENDNPDIQLARLRKEQIELTEIKKRGAMGRLIERADCRSRFRMVRAGWRCHTKRDVSRWRL